MGEFYIEEERKKHKQHDRYKNCKILIDKETKEVLLETREINRIKSDINDKFHTVAANEELRLDIIANNYYENPLLWWIIAQANDIYDPLSKPLAGEIIRIPSLISLYDKDGILL